MEYDEKKERFIVKITKTGQIKEVIRLSLCFNDEDQEKFKERVELAKLRQQTCSDEIRFFKYVDSVPTELVSKI